MRTVSVSFTLNGRSTALAVAPLTTLQTALREHLGLTATKNGCGQGGCGSCTVLVDGKSVLSCLLPLALVEGREVTTLEGIASPGRLHPLQTAFHEHFAAQCGYCAPGMIMAAKALLDRNPHPSRQEIAEALSGNLCRCTGYVAILDAVESVAGTRAESPVRAAS
jgi:aerobic carbon-monoxide dehydrogenase small subunit